MKTKLSEFFAARTTDDGGTEVAPFSMDPYQELMYECVNKMFSRKRMSAHTNQFVKYVEDRTLNQNIKVKINK